MRLRDYQQELADAAINSPLNVLIQADTGTGKTPIIAEIARRSEYVLVIAHRTILIRQASAMLAEFSVRHDIVGTRATRRRCILEQRRRVGRECLGSDKKYVCSIDSLLSHYRRGRLALDTSLPFVIIVDEAHHMIDENKWGRLAEIFPNARIIGVTATPCRGDNVSLKRGKGGVFDILIQAEELKVDSVKKLIAKGLLSDFKAYSVPEYDVFEKLATLRSGDYDVTELSEVMTRNAITFTSNAITEYKRLAAGKQAVAFCVSIQLAEELALAFRKSGVPAACISSKMSETDVYRVFEAFKSRQINVLTHCDMISEGVDVPAIEVMIGLRKTASIAAYRQWCGRVMRPDPGKDHAIFIDLVGNMRTHDLPDVHKTWSLEQPPVTYTSNLIECCKCNALIKAWLDECPECGADIKRHISAGEIWSYRFVDKPVVEIQRQKIAREIALNTEIQLQHKHHGGGALQATIQKMEVWFSESLRATQAVRDINQFLATTGRSFDFWIDHFTVADMHKNNIKKCERVFKKCQKLR